MVIIDWLQECGCCKGRAVLSRMDAARKIRELRSFGFSFGYIKV